MSGKLFRWVEMDETYPENFLDELFEPDEVHILLSLKVGQSYVDDMGDEWERVQ